MPIGAMSGFSLTVQSNAEIVRQGLQDLSADLPLVGRLGIYQTVLRVQTRIRNTPGTSISYPVNWDSEKQRKAFFASEGFGRGIPTVRSGDYQGSWGMQQLDNGYVLYSEDPAAIFIGGDFAGKGQSLIHEGRWPLVQDLAFEEIDAHLVDDVIEQLRYKSAEHGFEML